MRERTKDKERLEHILSAIDTILDYKDKYTEEDVRDNPVVFYGFVKLIEIIGEAVYMLTPEFRESHPEVSWRQIEKMRHVLVHGYYTIRKEDVWQTVTDDLPALKPQIEAILKNI